MGAVMPDGQEELVQYLSYYAPVGSALDRARYIAAGIALNHYMAIGAEDITVGDLDEIFRACFDAGVEVTKNEGVQKWQ
jgi:hypothetical protein